MPDAHARLGPSNHRWPHCPGSVREEAQYTDFAGEAAIDGTGSHLLLEMCLLNGCRADTYLRQIIGVNHHDSRNGWLVMEDRCERVQMCLDYVARRVGELKAEYPGCEVEVYAEQKADPGGMHGRSDWWGTVDVTIKASSGGNIHHVEVCDYKDGRGYVDVRNNTQLVSYLAGQLRPHVASGPDLVLPFYPERVQSCSYSIVQPKTHPPIRQQTAREGVTPSSVIAKSEELSRAAYLTDAPDAALVPGKHCQWCKANPKRGGHCTAQADQSIRVVNTMTTEVATVNSASVFERIQQAIQDVKALAPEQLSELADAKPALIAMFDKIEDEIKERIEQGTHVAGYAMMPGRSTRVWSDVEAVEKKLKGMRVKKVDSHPPKLLSPAQIEKASFLKPEQKTKLIEEFCVSKSGALKLARVDRNTAVRQEKDVQEMFKDVPKTEEFKLESPKPFSFL